MNLQPYFGHLFCEQLSRAISFSHYIALLTTSSNSSLVCLEMHFVGDGDGDCIENDLLALSYHYLLKNVILVETSQLKCHRPIVQNKKVVMCQIAFANN